MEICALTGHRDLPAEFDVGALSDKLEQLIRRGCRRFLCGMAMGFDLTALACLVQLRDRYPVTLVACIPFLGQERGFPEGEKQRYRRLLAQCNEKVILCGKYTPDCLLARNRYMVDRADVLLAYCTRRTGGTAYTVRYARSRGVPVEHLYVGGNVDNLL